MENWLLADLYHQVMSLVMYVCSVHLHKLLKFFFCELHFNESMAVFLSSITFQSDWKLLQRNIKNTNLCTVYSLNKNNILCTTGI